MYDPSTVPTHIGGADHQPPPNGAAGRIVLGAPQPDGDMDDGISSDDLTSNEEGDSESDVDGDEPQMPMAGFMMQQQQQQQQQQQNDVYMPNNPMHLPDNNIPPPAPQPFEAMTSPSISDSSFRGMQFPSPSGGGGMPPVFTDSNPNPHQYPSGVPGGPPTVGITNQAGGPPHYFTNNNNNNSPGNMQGPYGNSSSFTSQQQHEQQQRHENENETQTQSRKNSNNGTDDNSMNWLLCIGITIALVVAGGVAAIIVVAVTSRKSDGDPGPAPTGRPTASPVALAMSSPPSPAPIFSSPSPTASITEPTPKTTIAKIKEEGVLRCGVVETLGFAELDLDGDAWSGFDVDLCSAVAAAVDVELVQYIPVFPSSRFTDLNSGLFDLLAAATTHTMERELSEEINVSFSVPYLYNGLSLAGVEQYVRCADSLNISGLCSRLAVCIVEGTTHFDVIAAAIPNVKIVLQTSVQDSYDAFIRGDCNTIAGEQFNIIPSVVFAESDAISKEIDLYNYTIGNSHFSKEPLALVTRKDDVQWSDFVNWVVQALLTAEEKGITQGFANNLGSVTEFGEELSNSFIYAVRTVGNYGDLYNRNLEALIPRQTVNTINGGNSGLVYSIPFGNVLAPGPSRTEGSTLDKILDRGFLRCGIASRAIFAEFDPTEQEWGGFDVDFCRALAAAIFDGVYVDRIEYVDLTATERFIKLQNGEVDVLSRITTVTLGRDVMEDGTGVGFTFSQSNFYDGLSFGGIPPYGNCANNLDIISGDCGDLKICVIGGTTFETRVSELFAPRFLEVLDSGDQLAVGLFTGGCNAIAGGVVDVSQRNVGLIYDGPYEIGSTRYSKDPLALVTRQDDPQWSSFVYWIVSSIFYAEEMGITQSTSSRMPAVNLLGRTKIRIFRDAVAAVGSYKEIYERNVQAHIDRAGLNSLNTNPLGPQHYPYPGF